MAHLERPAHTVHKPSFLDGKGSKWCLYRIHKLHWPAGRLVNSGMRHCCSTPSPLLSELVSRFLFIICWALGVPGRPISHSSSSSWPTQACRSLTTRSLPLTIGCNAHDWLAHATDALRITERHADVLDHIEENHRTASLHSLQSSKTLNADDYVYTWFTIQVKHRQFLA